MNIITEPSVAATATAVRLNGDAKSRPIDAGSLVVDQGIAGHGREAVSWAEDGRRHHAPLTAVVEIIAEES